MATVSKLCDSWHPDISILSLSVTQSLNFPPPSSSRQPPSNWQTVNAGSMSDRRGPDEKIVYINPNIWTGYTYNYTVHTLRTCLVTDSIRCCFHFFDQRHQRVDLAREREKKLLKELVKLYYLMDLAIT